jgi:hypothetical protein
MSDQWQQEQLIQNDHLRKQIHALRNAPMRTFRKYVLHEVICAGCNETILTVLDTKPYRVVRTRDLAPTGEEGTAPDWRENASAYFAARNRLRRGEWRFFPIGDDDEVDAHSWSWHSVCRCRQWSDMRMQVIVESLRRGDRKRVVKPPGTLC